MVIKEANNDHKPVSRRLVNKFTLPLAGLALIAAQGCSSVNAFLNGGSYTEYKSDGIHYEKTEITDTGYCIIGGTGISIIAYIAKLFAKDSHNGSNEGQVGGPGAN